MHGRYPDYDVMEDADHWDPVTRELICRRAESAPAIRFFDDTEARCLGSFLDVVLAQDAEPRIPVLAMVDAKLYDGRLDGYRYVDMPSDPETWRRVAAALDETARDRGAADFASAGSELQSDIVGAFARGELSGPAWEGLNVARAWAVVMRAALSEFYSHPWAWNEIGFGGPRYPRGYMRFNVGPTGRDPNEAAEAFSVDPGPDVPARGLQ